eukprot:349893-Chlamydomonas_euryale.AAC.11
MGAGTECPSQHAFKCSLKCSLKCPLKHPLKRPFKCAFKCSLKHPFKHPLKRPFKCAFKCSPKYPFKCTRKCAYEACVHSCLAAEAGNSLHHNEPFNRSPRDRLRPHTPRPIRTTLRLAGMLPTPGHGMPGGKGLRLAHEH